MIDNNLKHLNKSGLQGELLFHEPLSSYTTWRVGGFAKALYKPANINDLAKFLSLLPSSEPVVWLGLGSNTLIGDLGFSGTVIVTQGHLDELTLLDDNTIYVEAGVSCAKMSRFCARNNFDGGEFWAGIPGTMGGALRMNAGCFNHETWDFILETQTITRHGEIKTRKPSEFIISYRNISGLNNEWFISAKCKLNPGDKDISLAKIKELLAHRAATQPINEYNCGSVFRNPNNNYAAKLIESCDLKGMRIGGAVVSEKHANFIINDKGLACAKDIELLIKKIQQIVYEKTAIELCCEVHRIGDDYAVKN